ncbi:MAG: S8 family serine peptidase [Thermoanaerobaculia bacterium]
MAEKRFENLPSLYIIHFKNPLKIEWIEQIEKMDEIKRVPSAYPSKYSLLYQINSKGAMDKILSFPFIKDIEKYKLEHKTKINLSQRQGKIKIRIKLNRGSNIEKFLKFLEGKGKVLNIKNPYHWLKTPSIISELEISSIYEILREEEVLWVEEIKKVEPALSTAREIIQRGTGDGCSGNQEEVPLWSAGITGAGPFPSCNSNPGTEQLIGIIDSSFLSPDLECSSGVPNCTIFKYVIYNTSTNPPCNIENSVNYCEGGFGHGTATAGIILGNGSQSGGESPVEYCSYKGISFGSRLWALKCDSNSVIFDCFNNCNGGDYTQLLRDFFLSSFEDGSRISSHSWTSYTYGEYDVGAEAVDIWAYDNDGNPQNGLQQNYLWFFSTGNAGPFLNSIGSPATAKNDISVGGFYNGVGGICSSCDNSPCNENKLVCYSSRGPTDDGRYGTEISGPTQFLTAPADTSGYVLFGGTSASTPAVAGTAALIRDWLINRQNILNPSAPLIKALLLNSGEYITSPSENLPGLGQGWGRPDLSTLCDNWNTFCNNIKSLWTEGSFSSSNQSNFFKFYVDSSSFPLKCTLTWFDPPNLLGGGALVNDLNLKIYSPDSNYYLGNNFSGGWSIAGGQTFDDLNNTEGVRVQNPSTGLWMAEIISENISESPQPYAFVCSGSVSPYIPPKPVPDGSLNTFPLKVQKIDTEGKELKIFWDSQCNPENTNIIYGNLSGLSSYQISGSKCDIQNPDIWSIGTTTDIWFVLVSDNGRGTESSWGFSSTGQRNGTVPSFQCGNILRDNSGTCP